MSLVPRSRLERCEILSPLGARGMGEYFVHATRDWPARSLSRYCPAHPGVWKIRTDGTGATRLVAGSTLLPEVSPDGRYVLYLTHWRTQRPTIRVAEVLTGNAVPFTIDVETTKTFLDVGRARWMPDGRSIAFLGEDTRGRLGIFAQSFTPGENTDKSRRPPGGSIQGRSLNRSAFRQTAGA